MAQRRFAHLYEAGRGRQGTGSHEIGRGLRRHDMDHVEPLFDPRELITALLFKCCDPGFSVDGDQSGFQVKMRTVALDIFHKRRNIDWHRSEEHTSELQSLMRISYAVFCLKKKNHKKTKATARKNKSSDKRLRTNK